MSQIYFKRCDHCGKISDGANVPNPPGWHSLMDQMHGTLGVIDFCPDSLAVLGIGDMLTKRARDRAVGVLKQLIPVDLADMREAIGYEGIVAAIEAGEYDDAFDSGDGINLAAASEDHRIEDAEVVPELEAADARSGE